MTSSENTVGRYELLRILGRGGMGEVYLARVAGPAGFEKLVALKLLGMRGDKARTFSLMREAMIGVQLDHAHVVQVLDFGEENGRYFIAMEYVRGYTVGHVIDHARQHHETLPLQSVVHLGRAIADALHYVHHVPDRDGEPLWLMHGDVSPGNVLLAMDGRIKLADFGVAALAEETEGAELIAGKPLYLPPEALTGETHCQAWDVYALGVVLYEAIAGRPAFEGSRIAEVRASKRSAPDPLADVRPDVPADLARVVHRAIDRVAQNRYASAADLRADLDRAYPRMVTDAERHVEYLTDVFGRASFVKDHGALPTTGGFAAADLAPYIAQSEELTAAVRSLPALRFGLSPALSAQKARDYGTRLGNLLTARLGRDVRTVVYADYQGLIDCLARGEVDFAWMPPVAFVSAADRGAGTLAMAERRGTTTYESAVIVGADSPIQRLEDLAGESIAWVDRESAAGYVFPAAEITRRLGKPSDVLGREHFHGSHSAACEAVANGWAAAGVTYAVRDDAGAATACGWVDLLGERAAEVRPIAFVGPIPSDNIGHRPHLPDKLVRELTDLLTGLAKDSEGRELLRAVFNADVFVRGKLALYDPVREAMRLVLSSD